MPAWLALFVGAILFAAGYALADRFQLTHSVLYRAAANDYPNAIGNLIWLAIQAAMLLAAMVLLSRKLFVLAMGLVTASVFANLSYGMTVNDLLDASKVSWLLAEARHARDAVGQLTFDFGLAVLQAAGAVILFILARRVIRSQVWAPQGRLANAWGAILIVIPTIIHGATGLHPLSAERNIYSHGVELAFADKAPARRNVDLTPDTTRAPRHIVWLIDESIAFKPFAGLIAPRLEAIDHVDFGLSTSFSNCSAPSNVALRSGVDVDAVSGTTDLRTTPTIWSYARAAGYRTVLIDGQTNGPPQNLLLEPERALIDEMLPLAGGMDTDLHIADVLNRRLRSERPSFTYVYLRGVHFQYRDHFPPGSVPPASPQKIQYEAALKHSKSKFFSTLLKGVDREQVAIVYTSDHGQNLAEGVLPHCGRHAVSEEFHVPLLAFLPDVLAQRYASAEGPRAASQIFPSTLIWMGFGKDAVTSRYDNELDIAPLRYVRFGRNVFPISQGAQIDVEISEAFPSAERHLSLRGQAKATGR